MGRFIDNYAPIIVSLLFAYLLYYYNIATYCNSVEFIKQFTTIGTCAFGFLLTMFSLIIQGNNNTVNRMKKRGKPFARFIDFNRKVVILSIITTLYAYCIGYLKLQSLNVDYLNISTAIFYFLLIWFVIELFYFLIIFYLLVEGEINNTEQ